MIDLSIVIVNWNTSKLLTQCLDSIYQSGLNFIFEVIVVDNASTDDSVSSVSDRFPQVHLIVNERNLGFAKANNQGIKICKGRYFLILNSDTLVLPGTLEALISMADVDHTIGVVGPKLLNMDGSLQKSWSSFPTLLSELTGQNFRVRRRILQFADAYEVDWIMGACMLVRADILNDVGMLDEEYFMYSEETDWCYRIKKTGWKVLYISNVAIYHLGGGSADRSSFMQLTLLYYSKILFFRKHYGDYWSTLLRYGLVIVNTLGLIRRILFRFGRDKKITHQRIKAQYKLIQYLLKYRYPLMNS